MSTVHDFVTTESARLYRITRSELRTHLVNSGAPAPDSTIDGITGAQPRDITVDGGATVAADFDGFFWIRTRNLRIPGWA